MHKLVVQYFGPASADHFERQYRERHVPLVLAIPGLARFTLTKARGAGGDDAAVPFLVAELEFEDGAAMKAGLSSPEMAAAAQDAETYDVTGRVMFTGAVEELA